MLFQSFLVTSLLHFELFFGHNASHSLFKPIRHCITVNIANVYGTQLGFKRCHRSLTNLMSNLPSKTLIHNMVNRSAYRVIHIGTGEMFRNHPQYGLDQEQVFNFRDSYAEYAFLLQGFQFLVTAIISID